MHRYSSHEAPRFEPPGHFGHLEVSNVVPKDIGGNFATQLSFAPPGGGGQMHNHPDQSQLFLVIDGELSFDTGKERFTLSQGQAVLFEPGEDHFTLNESDRPSTSVVITVDSS